MSILPIVFRDMMRPFRMLEHQMRLAEELLPAMAICRPVAVQKECIVDDRSTYQMKIDVKNFKPEEITVKTIDGTVLIEGRHEEKKDEQGFISRQFVRRFVLPEGLNLKDATSNLSSDGLLTITVPKKVDAEAEEQIIPITHENTIKEAA